MSQLPPLEITTAALAMAFCDLLAEEHAKFIAVLELLERKGLLQPDEVRERIQSIPALAPESVEADSQILQQKLRERMARRFQEMLLHLGPTGSTQ